MNLCWTDLAQPVVAGLAGILGIYTAENVLGQLRRAGLCPARWR